PGLAAAFADGDPDDMRALVASGRTARRSGPDIAIQSTRVRFAVAGLRTLARMGAGAQPLHDAAASGDDLPERLSVCGRAEGIFPTTGYRPNQRIHPGRSGHLVSSHAEKAERLHRNC